MVCTMTSSSTSASERGALHSSPPSIPGVSFTCTICYEDFDAVHRPPMVLPCGHTYVCLLCTKQIKRCMECREPLYLIPPADVASHEQQQCSPIKVGAPMTLEQMRSLRREATRSGLSTSSTPSKMSSMNLASPPRRNKTYLPLPIPKNAVLLAMMEHYSPSKNHCTSSRCRSTPISCHSDETCSYDEEDDLKQTYLSPPPLLSRSRSAGQGFETTLLHSDEVSVAEAEEDDYPDDEDEEARYPFAEMELASNLVTYLSRAFQAATLVKNYSMQSSSKDEDDNPILQ